MADIFAAVASGPVWTSLSMQLLESAQTLKALGDSIKDPSGRMRDITFELETMSLSIRSLGIGETDTNKGELLAHYQVHFEETITDIKITVNRLERLVQNARAFGKAVISSEEPEVRKLLEELEHAKSLISVAYIDFCQ